MRRVVRCCLLSAAVCLLMSPLPAGAQNAHSPNVVLDTNIPADTFINSDQAFWGSRWYAGSYGGFRILDISDPARPALLADFKCQGFQGDVSVWRNRLLFVSVDEPQVQPPGQPRGACSEPDPDPLNPTGFEGIRVFDVSDPRAPRFVTGVYADCGSHTHTLVPDLRRNRLLVYVTSYSLRPGPGCGPGNPQGEDPLHRKISIVTVPLRAPERARVIAEPPVDVPVFDARAQFGEDFDPTASCHDVQVFLELRLAAASCVSQAQLWDISNPARPRTTQPLARIDVPAVDFYHSAAFTWDGKYVVFGDETLRDPSECLPTNQFSRMWVHRVSNPEDPVSSFIVPRPQPGEFCTAHLFNFVPINGRYVMASSWYEAATSVIDFSNPRSPREIGFYDAQTPIRANTWATYWYRDFMYSSDRQRPVTRGLDVFHITDPWRGAAFDFAYENPQTQTRLLRCGLQARPRMLGVGRRRTVKLQVRARGGAVLPRQPVVGVRVVLRGVGISTSALTNRRGTARVTVRPTRAGVLRIAVRSVKNMLGCRASVRAAERPSR
jgi:LVIVD repeat